jgi:diguanylate cyclase (GGDEF)-like protein
MKLTDDLTGLLAVGTFNDDLEEVIKATLSENGETSVIFLDIDHFLNFNNSFGREGGDVILKMIAICLKQALPENSLIYRYSGDKFSVIMPGCEKENAFILIDRARALFNPEGRLQTEIGEIVSDISFSAGVAAIPDDGNTVSDIVRKAEGALFRAKRGNRNTVCLSRNERLMTKTSHYTYEQLQRLSKLAKDEGVGEALLLREALDDLLMKYDK